MFDFSALSPTDFENLVRDIIEAEESVRLESFGPGADQGIDLRYSKDGDDTIIQAKHYLRSGYSSLKSTCVKEAKKVHLLSPKRYVFATSVSMTPNRKSELIEVFKGVPLDFGDVMGCEDLNSRLEDHPEVVRKHFKLWLSSSAVLDQVLNSGLYARSESEWESVKDLVPRYVENGSLKAAEEILKQAGALVISGPAGIGKTTLARMLLWLHAEQGWEIRVIDKIDDAFSAISKGKKQIIFFDDFLGQVRVTDELVRGADSRFPPFLDRVHRSKNLRFILTSRDYILTQARQQSQRLSESSGADTNIILNVQNYSRRSRAEILYNHIYFSDLTQAQAAELISDDFYLKIIDHKNFNPRLIDAITKSGFLETTGLAVRQSIMQVLDKPELLWEIPYRHHFTSSAQALMIALTISEDQSSVDRLRSMFSRVCEGVKHEMSALKRNSEFEMSLKQLEGGALSIHSRLVSFANPGVRDFMISVIKKDELQIPLLSIAETYQELESIWSMASGTPYAEETYALEWHKEIRRILLGADASLPEELALLLRIYGEIGLPDTFIPTMVTIAEQLEKSQPAGLDLSLYGEILEGLDILLFPNGVKELIRERVIEDLVRSAQHSEHELSLDEVVDFMKWLDEHSGIPDRLAHSAHSAVDHVLSNISNELEFLGSTEEVASAQMTAENLASQAGLTWRDYADFFDNRYSQLKREDEEYERGTYEETQTVRAPHIDEASHIRSMFQSLKP